jgi:undecaprenyl-diphosphatase
MVTWWQALLLGLIQGLTEFIPVSSSAHLNITHWLLGQHRNLTFDVLLHIGTLFALVFYFRHDWVELLRNPAQAKLRNLVILACVPAVIAGLLLRELEEENKFFIDPRFNATMLIVMGLLLWFADYIGRKERTLEEVNLPDALIIGCSQALALVPGVSRSGATITFGLFRRLTREAAARFSFLMSVPITLGATIFEARALLKPDAFTAINASPGVMLLGIVASGLSGFWAIGFLLNYLKTKSVTLFVIWRIVVAILVFAVYYTPSLNPSQNSMQQNSLQKER